MSENYWSLSLESGWVHAAIWTIKGDATHVVAIGHPAAWANDDELVEAADTSLSSAAVSLPEGASEPSKTVFGVSPSWVTDGQIKKEYLGKIKSICDKLSLTPTGFVVLPEAISHFIKCDEGAPLNGIVIGVGGNSLDVAVFRLGNLSGTVTVGRSVSIVDDVIEALTRFGLDSLPSRILLYNGKSPELEDVKQQLIKSDWSEVAKSIKFLHTPAVEVFDPEKKPVAVALAGAAEMSNVTKVFFKKNQPDGKTEGPEPVEGESKDAEKKETKEATQNFFQNLKAADVGFMVGKDVATENPHEHKNIEDPLPIHKKRSIVLPAFLKNIRLPAFKRGAQSFPSKIFVGNIGSSSKSKVILIAIFVALIAGILAWWFLPKAEVTIFISPRQIEKSELVAFGDTIPMDLRTIEISGEKTAEVTGNKTVGEKAKGKVEVRNGTAVGLKIPSSTILVGPNDLKFSLDEVASVSAAVSPSSPGTVVVAVTAESIGSESNLAKGETFKVGNYPKSDVDAVVESDFAGGSSRQITAVSANDIKSLQEDLTNELRQEGEGRFAGEISSDEIFIKESLGSELSEKEFSHKVGDEASTLKLKGTMKLTAVIVKKSDLLTYADQILKDRVEEGFVLRPEQIKTTFESSSKDGDVWKFNTKFSANLLPSVDIEDIKNKIVGKYPKNANTALASIPGFVRAQIKFKPRLPGRLATLPHVKDNITLEISSEQ